MEISGAIVSRQLPYFSGVSTSKPCFSGPSLGELPVSGRRDSRFCLRARRVSVFPDREFRDNGHLQYYVGPRCGGKKEMVKEKKGVKKLLKLLKNLSKNFSRFSQSGIGVDSESGLVGEVQGKTIEEATEILLRQLKQLKVEEKELKRKRKQEKSRLKAKGMKNLADCKASSDSSSESSSSSDSECGEVIDMNCMRREVVAQPTLSEMNLVIQTSLPQVTEDAKPILNKLKPTTQETVTVALPSSSLNAGGLMEGNGIKDCSLRNQAQDCSSGTSTGTMVTGAALKKIEVCMGGKCKKSGAAALLEEFGRAMGVEGVVVGCKCMGKCRDGPNVRVLSGFSAEAADDSVRTPTNPLCIGVGLDDVNMIVSKFFGEEGKDLCMPQTA